MRLVYTADLHGDIGGYRALLGLAHSTAARAAIVGGDLLPHAIRREGALEAQRAFVERELAPLLTEARAHSPELGVYLLAGNDDWAAAIEALGPLEQAGLAFPLHGRVYRLTGAEDGRSRIEDSDPGAVRQRSLILHPQSSVELWLAGYACVPITPFSIKDYERRDEGPAPPFDFGMAFVSASGAIEPASPQLLAGQPSIADDLAALARQSDPARTIYVCHTPPAGTPLDLMPRGRHVGSRALRGFIERHAPPLTLHGHIHESPDLSGRYAAQIGATWCVNPGHHPGRFQAVALDTDDIAGTIEHTVFGRPV